MVDKSRLVPPGELTAYERWELPNMGSSEPRSRSGQSEATKVKPPTADQIENITKQAYESGFEEGYKAGFSKGSDEGRAVGHAEGQKAGQQAGYEQGLANAQQEVDKRVAALESQLAQIVDPISLQQRQVEEAMLNIAVAVSRAVIHRELILDSSSIVKVLTSVIDDIPPADAGAVLRVNPQDQALIRTQLDRLNSNLELTSDPGIAAGGFLLKTSTQLIDYTIEKRFQKTVQGMLSAAVNSKDDTMQEVPASIDSLSDFSTNTLNEFDEKDLVDEVSQSLPEPEPQPESEPESKPSAHSEEEELTRGDTVLESDVTTQISEDETSRSLDDDSSETKDD